MTHPTGSRHTWLRLVAYALPLATVVLLFGPLKAVPPEESTATADAIRDWAEEVRHLTNLLLRTGILFLLVHVVAITLCGLPRLRLIAAMITTASLLILGGMRRGLAEKFAFEHGQAVQKGPYQSP